MAENVLIISGSPRKNGNSEMLCDAFAAGAAAAGKNVEKISLAGKKIGFCTACYACHTGGCPQQDDAPAIIQKMLTADVIVLATPVYFFTMCAQLFGDGLPQNHRQKVLLSYDYGGNQRKRFCRYHRSLAGICCLLRKFSRVRHDLRAGRLRKGCYRR